MAKRRPNGDGAVRKRKDGRWEAAIVIGHKSDGSPIFKSVFAKTQKELMQKLHQLKDEYQDVDLSEDSGMLLEEWIDQWLEDYVKPTLRPSTYRGYACNMNYIKKELGKKMLRHITTSDVQKAYNNIKRNGRIKDNQNADTELSDNSVRGIHMTFHACMEAAKGDNKISRNPTEGTVIPKAKRGEMNIFNQAQMDTFMEVIAREPMWFDFFYVEITTGLRRGEICGLQWRDFDEKNGRLKVRRTISKDLEGKMEIGETKTEKGSRDILLPPSTLHLLKERKKNSITQWIFPSPLYPEKPIAPSAAYHRLKTILRQNDLPDIRFHDLRHTFATYALTSGVDAKTLAEILGHTNASFTLDTYTHVTTDMQRNAAGVVGDFMKELMED